MGGLALLLQRVIDGLSNGALYGSLGLALTLVYRASGRVNLAQGELATFGTYLSLVLSSPASPALAGTILASQWLPATPWPRWLAIPGAMVLSAVLAAVLERVVVRRVPEGASQAAVSVSVALLLIINAVSTQWWRAGGRGYASPFPDAVEDRFMFAGARLRYTTIGTWATLLVTLAALHLLLRSRLGLAFRAVFSQRTSAALCGVRVGRVLSGSWALAAGLGTLVGCLAASRVLLTPNMMMRVLVYGLVAASIGGLSSPGGALLGGIIVGIGQAMLGGYVPGVGSDLAFPLVVLAMIVMLYLRPHGLFGQSDRHADVEPSPAALRPPDAVRARYEVLRHSVGHRLLVALVTVVTVVVLVGGGMVLPFVEARLLTEVVATGIAAFGLTLLLGDAGRMSLGHASFMGVGAYATAVIAHRAGVHPFVAAAAATGLGFVAGGLLALPALRIRGQYLAMVTLCLAVIFPALLNRFDWFTGGELGPPPTSTPQGPAWLPLPDGRTFAWLHVVVVLVAVAVVWAVNNLRRSAVGRAIRATAQNDQAAEVMGVRVTRTRTATFAISSALAALGGALVALQTQAVTSSRYDVFRSLALYALVSMCGADALLGAALAAVLFVGVPWLLLELDLEIGAAGVPPDAPGGGAYLIWGGALLLVTIVAPDGIVAGLRRHARRLFQVVDTSHPRVHEPLGAPAPVPAPTTAPVGSDGLELLDPDAPLGRW